MYATSTSSCSLDDVKCAYCESSQTQVTDSRLADGDAAIRRRRECSSCGQRFTTYERYEEVSPLIRKRDGRLESFDRNKLSRGLRRATAKRPVEGEAIDALVEDILAGARTAGREVHSDRIGRMALSGLRELDDVAYVRFASVYRNFTDIEEFKVELEQLDSTRTPTTTENRETAAVPTG